MPELVIPNYLFRDITNPDKIWEDLYDLCCDEYYKYFDIIDKKILNINHISNLNLRCNLLVSCGYTASIEAFEYLNKKLKINISDNLLINGNDDYILKKILKYNLKTEFYRYIINNYNLNIYFILELCSKIYFNSDIDFVIELHNKIDEFIEKNGYELIKNEYILHIKIQFTNAFIHNQIFVILFLICKVKNILLLNSETLQTILLKKFTSYLPTYNNKDMYDTLDIINLYFTNHFDSNIFNNKKIIFYDKNIYYYLQNKGIFFEQSLLVSQLYQLVNLTYQRQIHQFIKTNIDSMIKTICWIYCNINDKKLLNHYRLFINNDELNDINQCILDTNFKIDLEYSNTLYYEYYIYKKICNSRKKYIEFYNKIYFKKKYNYKMVTI
jgi:hypothetical protein